MAPHGGKLWLLALAAVLLSPGCADVSPGGADQSMPGLGFLNDDYAHVAYHFSSVRQGSRRWGEGELWLSLGGPNPRVRLKGYAFSPRFGHGEITLVLDSAKKVMYAFLKLVELQEAQCMSFPFPRSKDDPERLRRLRWRQRQVADHWTLAARQGREEDSDGKVKLAVNWTKSYTLDLLLNNSLTGTPQVRGVDLRHQHSSQIVKQVRIRPEEDVMNAPNTRPGDFQIAGHPDVFTMPYSNCTLVSKVSNPLLLVEIKPPHKKSSALGDLLLVLADSAAGGQWPRAFLALCALVVPGDVAVMIEEPPPPDLDQLDGLSFDYSAKVFRLGGNVSFDDPAKDLQDKEGNSHVSSGSLTLDLIGRSLRLHGEEQYTKVGRVVTDILAHGGGDDPQVWANILLPAQGEHHCGVYGFPPQLPGQSTLVNSARHELSFVGIDSLGDEDCGIFAATLPRDRQVYIWVDMESDKPAQFLRAEVRKDGRRLRRVDIVHWDTVDGNQVQMQPEKEWNCTGGFQSNPFVHLGLRHLKAWSVELQDALRSLRELPRWFVALEMLALTGDVCLMVKEPDPPELWRLPGLSFNYKLFLGSVTDEPGSDFSVGEGPFTQGHASVDHMQNRFQITARALTAERTGVGSINISLSWNQGTLAVRVQHDGDDQCLTLVTNIRDLSFTPPPPGIFDGVELIGDSECDRFTFAGRALQGNTTVKFWLSREDPSIQVNPDAGTPGPVGGRVCKAEVASVIGAGATAGPALLYVSDWEETYSPAPEDTADWGCVSSSEVEEPWARFAAQPLSPDERLSDPALWPAAPALGRLMQAFSVMNAFPKESVDEAMARLIIHLPPKVSTTTTPAPLHLLSPEMTTISFNFRSRLKKEGATRSGYGVVWADLAKRHLYLRSVAHHISAGIPHLESEVYWAYDQQRLVTRTQLGGYQQCWQVSVMGPSELPSAESRNPFLHFIRKGLGKEVGDHLGPGKGDKYIIYLDPWTIAELFTDSESALRTIHFKDFKDPKKASEVDIEVENWSSQFPGDGPPHPDSDGGWGCMKVSTLDGGRNFLAWDIIRLLFPSE